MARERDCITAQRTNRVPSRHGPVVRYALGREQDMNATQRRLVRESWARVIPIKDQAAALFYGRLFERYPEVRAYFSNDMAEQGRKLMQVLDTAVGALDRIDELSPTLRELGRRHAAYGVSDAD
jgi:hemoglobin-like flavoprotein